MSGSAFFLAIAILTFALYMLWLSNRSERGAMGRSGPGIRTAETTKCEHTWAAAQQVAVPIYRLIAMYLSATAAAVLALGFVNGTIAVVIGLVVAIGVQVFFLGVASVRARKAALAIRCEHNRPLQTPSTTPPHRRKKKRR